MIAKFYLYHHWWMGSKVIRGIPVSHFDLRLDENKPSHRYFKLDKDPTYYDKGIVAVEDKCDDERWLTFEGIIPPRGKAPAWLRPANPNKKIPAHLDKIDSGKVNIISDTPMFISFIFSGKEIKGYWILRNASPEEAVWVFEKNKLPKSYNGKDLGDKRNLQKIPPEMEKEIIRLSKEGKSRPEISRLTSTCQATVYYYQKHYGLV